MTPPRRATRALAVALLGVVGCVTLPAPMEPPPLDPGRLGRMLVDVREQGAGRHALRALASVVLDAPEGSGRFREVILAERPARLRLETLSILGQTQTLLVTDGERYSFFDGREVTSGAASREVLRSTLGFDLDPREAVEALLVRADAADGHPLERVWWDGETHRVEVGGTRLGLDVDGELRLVEALGPGGYVRWSATYDRWREVAGGRYPFVVGLDFPAGALRAELRLRTVELNPALDPDLFRIDRSPGGEAP